MQEEAEVRREIERQRKLWVFSVKLTGNDFPAPSANRFLSLSVIASDNPYGFFSFRCREKLWKDYNYVSLNTALDNDEEDVDEESDALDEDDDSERKDIQYVRGDVTHPINTRSSDAIIVHCVGQWRFLELKFWM